MGPALLDAKTAQIFRLYQKIQALDLELLSAEDEGKKKDLVGSRDALWKEKCSITDGHLAVLRDRAEIGSLPANKSHSTIPPSSTNSETIVPSKITACIDVSATPKSPASDDTLLVAALHIKINNLQLEISKLKEAAHLTRPLLEIGIAVRKRHFEQIKYKMLVQDSDLNIIQAGNIAAHHPNLIADIALLEHLPLLKATYMPTLKAIFQLNSQSIDSDGNLPSIKEFEWDDKNAEIANLWALNHVEKLGFPSQKLVDLQVYMVKLSKLAFGGRVYGELEIEEKRVVASNRQLGLLLENYKDSIIDGITAKRSWRHVRVCIV